MVAIVRGERPILDKEAKFLDWLVEFSTDQVIELDAPEQRAEILNRYSDHVLAEREKMFDEIFKNPPG